jgi:hypothetical protein
MSAAPGAKWIPQGANNGELQGRGADSTIHRWFAPNVNIPLPTIPRDSIAGRCSWGVIPASTIAQCFPWGVCPNSPRFHIKVGMAESCLDTGSVAQHCPWGRSVLESVAHCRQWGMVGSVAHAFKWGVGPRFSVAQCCKESFLSPRWVGGDASALTSHANVRFWRKRDPFLPNTPNSLVNPQIRPWKLYRFSANFRLEKSSVAKSLSTWTRSRFAGAELRRRSPGFGRYTQRHRN